MGAKKAITMAVPAAARHRCLGLLAGAGDDPVPDEGEHAGVLLAGDRVGRVDVTNGADFQKRLIAEVDEAERAVIVDHEG